MSDLDLLAEPLTADAFAGFGEVLEADSDPDQVNNVGTCGRWHDLVQLEFTNGRVGISLFKVKPQPLPHRLELLMPIERQLSTWAPSDCHLAWEEARILMRNQR